MTLQNKLLATLTPAMASRLLPQMRFCTLAPQESLLRPEEPIRAVWFIERGCVSLMASTPDGKHAEVGLIGSEGMIGQSLVTGAQTASTEAVVRVGGTALRMEADGFRRIFETEGLFRETLIQYGEVAYEQAVRIAICNGHHTVNQRLARWLLMVNDRSGDEKVPITQEQLSSMLCVQRPTVTLAAQMLQQAGLIRCTRGAITILDRNRLRTAVCDCYRVQKARFDSVMKPRSRDGNVYRLAAAAVRPRHERDTGRGSYRVHLLDADRRNVAVFDWSAVDDNDARETASILFDGCGDVLSGFELWRGAEMIASDRDTIFGRPLSLAALSSWRQQKVCEREEMLTDSFACIRDSRKLVALLSDFKRSRHAAGPAEMPAHQVVDGRLDGAEI